MKIVIERNARAACVARCLKNFDVLRLGKTYVADMNGVDTALP